MRMIPDLIARAVGRRYAFPERSSAIRKLRRTIDRRDAIVHPRWDRYLDRAGWYEAAEAVRRGTIAVSPTADLPIATI